jgi:AraC-like DNA-binding protein
MRFNKKQFYFQILLVFKLTLFSNVIMAQNESKQSILFSESKELIYSKPNEALKIGLHLLKNSTSDKDKARINFLLANAYQVKGDYSNALTYLFEADKYASELTTKEVIEILIAKAEISRALYFVNQFNQYIKKAEEKAATLTDSKEKEYVEASIIMEKAVMKLHRRNYKEALSLIEKQKTELTAYPELDIWFSVTKGRIYSGLEDYEKGNFYFDKASHSLENLTIKNNFAKVYILGGLANISFHKKDHQKAIELLSEALETSKTMESMYLSQMINRQLAINYLALNDKVNYKFYNSVFVKLNAELENSEQDATNNAFNLISKEFENNYAVKKQSYNNRFYIIVSLFALVVLVTGGFWFKYQWEKKRLNEIINYLEVTRNNLVIRYTEKKDISKKIFIPEETEQALLSKLKRFENTVKFTNNDMSLAVLAGQFETNTKYLSEIINKHYEVNFNTYINKLRINFIVEKLKSDPNFMNYKISYLAEACGFSSHSSFATVFKSITGIAPITFIELLKSEKEIGNV